MLTGLTHLHEPPTDTVIDTVIDIDTRRAEGRDNAKRALWGTVHGGKYYNTKKNTKH